MTHHERSLRRVVVALALLAALTCPGWAQQYHNKVVIVLDASGSMASPMSSTGTIKMAAAKEALKQMLTKVPETTHIGLLVFGARNIKDPWLYPLGPRDDQALRAAIDLPAPRGKTPLGEFIKKGADRLLREREKQFGYASYRLLVVTDGEATDGALMERYVPQVLARGITVDVIGVDMKQQHTLATKVHSYRRADDPKALAQALAEVLAEVSTDDTDAAGEQAFELLAPIPLEMGAAMLEALSHANNTPIGQHPQAARARQALARRQQQAKGPGVRRKSAPGAKKKTSGGSIFGSVVGAVIVIGILAAVIKRRSR